MNIFIIDKMKSKYGQQRDYKIIIDIVGRRLLQRNGIVSRVVITVNYEYYKYK